MSRQALKFVAVALVVLSPHIVLAQTTVCEFTAPHAGIVANNNTVRIIGVGNGPGADLVMGNADGASNVTSDGSPLANQSYSFQWATSTCVTTGGGSSGGGTSVVNIEFVLALFLFTAWFFGVYFLFAKRR